MMQENIEYIQKGLIDPKNYYSHVLPMDRLDEILDLVRNKKALKVIMTID
jgi:L-iditol 2-dehydrogenase